MNASRIWRLSGISKILFLAPVIGQIAWRIESTDWNSGDGGESRIAVGVEVYARGCTNWLFRSLLERRREGFLGPGHLGRRGVPAIKHFVDRGLGNHFLTIRAHSFPQFCCLPKTVNHRDAGVRLPENTLKAHPFGTAKIVGQVAFFTTSEKLSECRLQ